MAGTVSLGPKDRLGARSPHTSSHPVSLPSGQDRIHGNHRKGPRFGFWWFVATLALAVAIGLILAVVLSPVLGLLAAIGVGIWMLVRRSRSSDNDEAGNSERPEAAGIGHSTAGS